VTSFSPNIGYNEAVALENLVKRALDTPESGMEALLHLLDVRVSQTARLFQSSYLCLFSGLFPTAVFPIERDAETNNPMAVHTEERGVGCDEKK
jgi:hypothetical protein